jgi:hypothetical protein
MDSFFILQVFYYLLLYLYRYLCTVSISNDVCGWCCLNVKMPVSWLVLVASVSINFVCSYPCSNVYLHNLVAPPSLAALSLW